mmetsp:Transcript_8650/g.25433  ORF Transcript_8650/g.25433 Transcript_8650/m.25433 type:complete len:200 (-) Transcript_8650:239-838(-)
MLVAGRRPPGAVRLGACPLLPGAAPPAPVARSPPERRQRSAAPLFGGRGCSVAEYDLLPAGRRDRAAARLERLPRHDAVDLDQDRLEREVDVGRVERRRLDEGEVVLLRKGLCVLRRARLQMLEVALVPHQHHHNRRVCVRPQLLQPALDVLKGEPLRDVIDEQRAHRAAVVRRRDGAVALLTGGVPDLRFNDLPVVLD